MDHDFASFCRPLDFCPIISPLLTLRFNFRKNVVPPHFNTGRAAQKRARKPITTTLSKCNQNTKGLGVLSKQIFRGKFGIYYILLTS